MHPPGEPNPRGPDRVRGVARPPDRLRFLLAMEASMSQRTDQYTDKDIAFGEREGPGCEPGVIFVFRGNAKYGQVDGEVVAVDFYCPCGCGLTCYTPVVPEGSPARNDHTWTFSRGPTGGVTLSPSIRYLSGCLSHFNVTDGKVVWHADTGRKVP